MTKILRKRLERLLPEILKTIRMIFWEDIFATKAIQNILKVHHDWDENKRAIFSETVYDLIRW